MAMDDRRVGFVLRALRLRLGLRQLDVGARAGVSQQLVSLAELGRFEALTLHAIRRIATAVGASYDGDVRWRGGAVDRLLDEAHAVVVGQVVRALVGTGWRPIVEVTYQRGGDRGSIDVLADRPDSGILFVGEIKSEIASVEETNRTLDKKVRLAPWIGQERFGRRFASVAPVLVVLDTPTNRRRIERHDPIFRSRFPLWGQPVRGWLRAPFPIVGALWFLSPTNGSGGDRLVQRRQRMSRPRTAAVTHDSGWSGAAGKLSRRTASTNTIPVGE